MSQKYKKYKRYENFWLKKVKKTLLEEKVKQKNTNTILYYSLSFKFSKICQLLSSSILGKPSSISCGWNFGL